MAMTNTAEKTAPLGPCDGCEWDVDESAVRAFRVETHSGQEFVARWCADCREVAMQLDDDIKTIRDIWDVQPSAADFDRVGFEPGLGIVPVRIIVDLPSRPDCVGGEANCLATWDGDEWLVVTATFVDGSPAELDDRDIEIISAALDERRANG